MNHDCYNDLLFNICKFLLNLKGLNISEEFSDLQQSSTAHSIKQVWQGTVIAMAASSQIVD